MLYNDKQKKIFKKVVKKLRAIEIDGESTQQLLQKIGHEEQMLRQLIMSMPIDIVVALFKERVELERDCGKTVISPIDSNIEHRLKMIHDDLKVIRDYVPTEILTAPTNNNESLEQCLNNIEIACDLTSDESLSWRLYSDSNKTMGEKLNEFYTKLDEDEEYFEFDKFQGTCHVVCSGSKISFNCTPFWEDDKHISVEVVEDHEKSLNNFKIVCIEPKTDEELETFKSFYIKLVQLLIKSLT